MSKKHIAILTITFFLCFGLGIALFAQKFSVESISDVGEAINQLIRKVDKIEENIEASHREILKNLNQIIDNQKTIKKELDKIRIRASQ